MADLFSVYERAPKYAERLKSLGKDDRLREADVKAIASVLEERARFLELLERVKRLRASQRLRDGAIAKGVSKAQGVELLQYECDQLERAIDRELGETLK